MKIISVKSLFHSRFHYVKVETDEGIHGIGECTLNSRQLAVDGVIRHLNEVLPGRDPQQIEDLWQEIYRGTFWRGGPVLLSALSGIDMALWDIKGKALHTPVYNLLGGKCRDKVRVYISIRGQTPEEAAENALFRVGQGYTVLRMCMDQADHGIYEPGKIVRRSAAYLEAVRRGVGEDVELIFECHTRYTPVRAVELAQAVAPYHPLFIEDAIRADSPEAYRHLRRHSNVPLGTSEKLGAIWDYKALIEEDLVDYLRPDICNCGGISSMRKIAAYGESHYLELVPHGVPHVGFLANLHADFSIPNFYCQEDWLSDSHPDCLDYDVTFQDGFLTMGDRPGLGISVDESALLPYESYEHPHWRREDGTVQDW